MANNLLNCGWVEYWEPSVALGSLRGMIAGKNWAPQASWSVVTDSEFPAGTAMEVTGFPTTGLLGADPLWEDFGSTDFLAMFWSKCPDSRGIDFTLGFGDANGFDLAVAVSHEIYGVIPCSDYSYPYVDSFPATPYASDLTQPLLFWWTVADKTLHMQLRGGAEYTTTSPVGAGPPDPFNEITIQVNQTVRFGDVGICKAPIPDATQRALLFAGTPFSQFDNGGGGPGTEDCRASAIMVSLPWRGMYPQPDGTIGLGDRIQTAFMYRCIAEPPSSGGGPDIVHAGRSYGAGGYRQFVRIGR